MDKTANDFFANESDDGPSSSDESWEPDGPDTDSDVEMIFDLLNSPLTVEPYNPPSLAHIAKFNIAELVYDVCVNIERRYGSYGTERCAERVDTLCGYLVSEIGRLVSEVWEEIVIVAGRKRILHRIKDHNILTRGLNSKLSLTVEEWQDLITGKDVMQ